MKQKILNSQSIGYVAKVDNVQINDLSNKFAYTAFITSSDNKTNPEPFFMISIFIISNIILTLGLFKNMKIDYDKLRFLGYTRGKSLISIGYIFIILNIIIVSHMLF